VDDPTVEWGLWRVLLAEAVIASLFPAGNTVIVSHGELLIEPKQQHKQIVNIETWTDAFLIFTSIYCTTHPLKFQDLLRYIHG
jgi:hypothetical protein